MIINLIVAINLVLALFNFYMVTTEAETIIFILDWMIEHEEQRGGQHDESA